MSIQHPVLTPEDQHIFEMWNEKRAQERYRWSDGGDFIRSGCAIRTFGHVRDCVRVMETARRSIERRS